MNGPLLARGGAMFAQRLIGPQFEVTHRPGRATIVLPAGFELGEAVEITTLTDSFAKYMTRDGRVVDCAVYAKQLEEFTRGQR